jgi:hypothetical protein
LPSSASGFSSSENWDVCRWTVDTQLMLASA